jgi:hypothetical protein
MKFSELLKMSDHNKARALGQALFMQVGSISEPQEAQAALSLFSVCAVEKTATTTDYFGIDIVAPMMLATVGVMMSNGQCRKATISVETCHCGKERVRFAVELERTGGVSA